MKRGVGRGPDIVQHQRCTLEANHIIASSPDRTYKGPSHSTFPLRSTTSSRLFLRFTTMFFLQVLCFFLLPLLALAKIELTSFSYSQGTVTATWKTSPGAPANFGLLLRRGAERATLIPSVDASTGSLTYTLPSNTPIRSGYKVQFVADASNPSSEIFDTSDSFSVAEGDFANVSASTTDTASLSSASGASLSASASSVSASISGSISSASASFTSLTGSVGSSVSSVISSISASATGSITTTISSSGSAVTTLVTAPQSSLVSAVSASIASATASIVPSSAHTVHAGGVMSVIFASVAIWVSMF